MKLTLHAIGKRMPSWVREGFDDYQSRLPGNIQLQLREIALPERGNNPDIERLKTEEGQKLIAPIDSQELVIALDQGGKSWSSEQLAEQMQQWLDEHVDVSLLIGGPDGLSKDCLSRARQTWSLSNLTLPHMLVRVVVAEQLYRAWTILQGHPYHR